HVALVVAWDNFVGHGALNVMCGAIVPTSCLGQPHDEPCAEHAAGGVAAVLGTDAPAQRLDDLPADRQAEAGMLAETLALRALRIEPVENMLEPILGDAGAVILDADLHHAAGLARAETDAAIGRAERVG